MDFTGYLGCSFNSLPAECYAIIHDSGILRTAASNGAGGFIVLGTLNRTAQSFPLVCHIELMDFVVKQEVEEGEQPLVALP